MIILISFLPMLASTVNAHVAQQMTITPNVFPLVTAPRQNRIAPSSHFQLKRHLVDTVSPLDSDLITLGGRVYMTNITLGGHEYTMVIDSGSSDTWVPSTAFQCIHPMLQTIQPQKRCGFGALYDKSDSPSFQRIPLHTFGVKYTDGEFLTGIMGTEELGIGGVNEDQLKVRQTIGVVERGWWMGDGLSSGLMGLAFPTLASNVQDLNYTSVMWTLFESGTVPPIFSLALSRPTVAAPAPGGLLAIGGIPDVPHKPDFASVPIHPIISNTYAFYSIPVDGFSISPPATTAAASAPPQNYAAFPVSMIVDSGSSLLHFPDAIADYIASLFVPRAIYSASSDTYLVPCSAAAPRVGITIAGKTFFVNEQDLMNKGPGAVRQGRAGLCTVAVLRAGRGDAVLGDTWLKGVLAVFDLGANEMRFAARENY